MKRRDLRRRPISLLLWGTVLILAVAGYILSHPFELTAEDPRVAGEAPPASLATREPPAADVAVVLWPQSMAHSAESGRFEEVEFSWAWVDTLQAEFGPVRVIEADELERVRLEDLRVVVVTHSAALFPGLSEEVHRLEHFVNQGGVLVLERPEGSLREAFSADGSGGMRTPRQITSTAEVTEDVANALAQLPLFTRFVGSTGPLEGAETLLAMDGAPVVYRLARSEGWAVTVDFNYGAALVALQQGHPSGDEFEVVPTDPALGPTVDDLIADPLLRVAEVPVADLLEHFLVHVVVGRRTPLPGLWPYPEGAAGVVVLSHDVAGSLERARWMVEYEAARGATSDLFVGYSAAPPATEESPAALAELAGRTGVLWERGGTTQTGGRHRIGLGGIRPFVRNATLAEVRAHVAAPFGEEAPEVAGVRTFRGRWDRDWAEPFTEMAAAGFGYDVSYGRAPAPEGRGPAYRHGTGRPFRVHDANGLPLDLFEVPIVAPDLRDEATLEALDQMLRRSQRAHHQAIGVDVPGEMFTDPQALAIFDAWQSLLETAQRREHLVLSPGQLVDFRRQRETVSLRSEMYFARDAGPRAEAPFQLRIEIGRGQSTAPLTLRIPAESNGRRFREARIQEGFVDEGTALETTPVRLFGEELLLVPLPAEGWTDLRVNADYR
jgi:hypothetical protein